MSKFVDDINDGMKLAYCGHGLIDVFRGKPMSHKVIAETDGYAVIEPLTEGVSKVPHLYRKKKDPMGNPYLEELCEIKAGYGDLHQAVLSFAKALAERPKESECILLRSDYTFTAPVKGYKTDHCCTHGHTKQIDTPQRLG